ncbi:MAG: hypothetical protein A4E57_01549 [Syntrophorhabdaceae bacterium PtaU1.Bin034]|jgi:Cu/Ag efflux protein CusF|nr:MAG: hypothetical protein A4E57_01549 [Syntrophorhabdaceae bacterium PtaU1.Bin034]
MMIRRLIVLVMVAAFTFGVAGMGFSAQEVKGTVAKIEGNKVTVLDNAGKQTTVTVQDPMTLQGLKVGDNVSLSNGQIGKR